jgi:hypothetical protein
MEGRLALGPVWRRGAAGLLWVAAFIAFLCVPGIARAATPQFYAETIDEGAGSEPTWVKIIDVNHDGKLDLVTALSNYDVGDPSKLGLVSVRIGDGKGGFGPAKTFSAGGRRPYSLDVADLTGDGELDVAVANRSSHSVTVLKGDGTGNFVLSTRQPPFNVGTETIDVKAVDLDDDGDMDLVATQMWNVPYTDGYLWLLYNDGTGFFRTVDMPLADGTGCTVMGVGDLNGDGSVDVVVGHDWPSVIPPGTKASVLLNDHLGPHGSPIPTTNLVEAPALEVGPHPQGATIADFNEDGDADVCVTSRYPNNANIFLGDGTGAFTGPTSYAVGPYAKVPTPVDLDKDGHLDLAVCNYGNEGADPPGTTISILTGNGDGTFDAASSVTVGERPHSVAAGDLNGDGWPDLAIPNLESDDVSVLFNTTPYSSDTTKPVTTSNADGAWHTGAVTVTLSPTDGGGSGVMHTRYRIDGGAWQWGTSVHVSGDGNHTVQYYSVDYAGNVENTHSAQVKIDGTAPATASSADDAWHASPFTVTLDPQDALSGVASTHYRVDDGGWQEGTSVEVSGSGVHDIDFYSVDNAGNTEGTKTAQVKLDTTAPVTASSADTAWHKGPVTVTFTPTDGQSGVASTHYRVDGAAWKTGTSVAVSGDGAHSLEFYSVDAVGNPEDVKSAQVKVDDTAPTVAVAVPADGAYYVQGSGAACAWTGSDTLSGVASETATIDGVPVAKGDRVDLLDFGPHAFSLTVTDVAGNQRIVTTTYTIPLPHSTLFVLSTPTSTITYGKSRTIRATLKDLDSDTAIGGKVVQVEWSYDQATWTPLNSVTLALWQTATGEYTFTVSPKRRTYYRFVFAGDGSHRESTSDPMLVKVRPSLSRPQTPRTRRVGAIVTVWGKLKPHFRARARTVTIRVVRYNGRRWVTYAKYRARNADYRSYSKYVAKFRIKRKGAFKFKATTRSTYAYAAAKTSYSRIIRIR